ncbi:MAG: hypothetical protein K5662_09165 [Lachnospiraceae bacterium]|nr:hypothetical protein [Lachnospiraceae bacterium]
MYTCRQSVYLNKPDDPMGIFFTPEEFPELDSHPDDVAPILQDAIGRLIREQCYGIIYIPEGIYPICSTVRIPPAVRLIGYGSKRPMFYIPASTPYFRGGTTGSDDPAAAFIEGYPGANYMFWFIGERDYTLDEPRDANAGTFYSALSNIDFKIEDNNPYAICIRAHFAQHGFISHCHFDLAGGLAGMFDVGNEMEDLTFTGGRYGMICRMTSPGWPFILLDSRFDSQTEAAILTSRTGFTGFRLHISNTPRAFDLYEDAWEKLYLEDCILEDISDSAFTICMETAAIQQVNLKDVYCRNVPILNRKKDSNSYLRLNEDLCLITDYTCGYCAEDNGKMGAFKEDIHISSIDSLPTLDTLPCDIPAVPALRECVSVIRYGAVGDGVTDDTEALQRALDSESKLFFPQGIYRITDTLTIKNDTTVIGMSPITTQIIITDDEPAFSGFGTPKPVVDTVKGVNVYLSGIGIDTAGKNPRAVGICWRANAASYMNDVKFMGGHGLMYRDGHNAFATLYNPSRTADYDPDRIWDYQYSSLWITEDGGGTFKDIWSASPYAEAGILITDTETKTNMYQVSLEHHVRHEIKMKNVKNLTIYGLQTEEEKAEGLDCLPIEMSDCSNINIVNYFLFRVVAVAKTFDHGIRLYNCKDITFRNLHNKAQMQYTFTLSLKDMTTGFTAKNAEYALLTVKGNSGTGYGFADVSGKLIEYDKVTYRQITEGYDFIQGVTVAPNDDLYWCDKLTKTIYRYDHISGKVTTVLSIHFYPSALSFDTQGNMIVAADYSALKTTVPGQSVLVHDWKNFHPFFAWFYKRSEKTYAFDPKAPYSTMTELARSEYKPEFTHIIRPAEMDYPGMFDNIRDRKISEYYVAPDGCTAIEATIDLARSLRLGNFCAGERIILTDDSTNTTLLCDTDKFGNYTSHKKVAFSGKYGADISKDQRTVRTVEDSLNIYEDGVLTERYPVPEDAYSVISSSNACYVIGRHSIYEVSCR